MSSMGKGVCNFRWNLHDFFYPDEREVTLTRIWEKKILILESSRKSGNGLLWCVAPLQLKCKRLNLNIQWELCVL